jgi:hypothetical protein
MTPQEAGEWLFNSLVAGDVLTSFNRSLGSMEGRDGAGLRIRLMFDRSPPELAEISALPWELMRQPGSGDHLALGSLTPVVRFLDVPRVVAAAPLLPSLRILIVASCPASAGALDLEREKKRLIDSWRGDPRVQVEELEPPTLDELQRRLTTSLFHVLHFMGHGDFDPATGKGRLLFEDERGRAQPVNGSVLGEIVNDRRALRLLVLNACTTAGMPRRGGQDAFSGVATAVLRAGIPAVVAMRRPIYDDAAVAFSAHFYTALAAGQPVDAATAAGRVAIHAASPESLEWATPVLFMSVPDGQILAAAEPSAVAAPAARADELAGPPVAPRGRRWLKSALFLLCVLALAAALPLGKRLAQRWGTPPGAGETIEAEEAARHLKETATVCGNVAAVQTHDEASGKPTFIAFGKPYPEQLFTGVIWGSDRSRFGTRLDTELIRRRICLTGTIVDFRGKLEIVVHEPSQLALQPQ